VYKYLVAYVSKAVMIRYISLWTLTSIFQ